MKKIMIIEDDTIISKELYELLSYNTYVTNLI